MEEIKYSDCLQEVMYTNELSSGIKCYIIPRRSYVEKQAAFAVNYGSVDINFQTESALNETPYGIAHFLEHKLFENKEFNVFERFSRLGAVVNAFTNFTNTAYYFNCIDRFDQNIKLLLDFTQSPYFTDENVEKEKGIIIQEINMYMDNPHWSLFTNLQKAMYHRSPVRIDIAGTEQSISRITAKMLYECYEAFYYPGNTAIVCAGDLDPQHVYDLVERHIKPRQAQKIRRIYGDEPHHVRKDYIEGNSAVTVPMFSFGFKEDLFDENITDKVVATKLLVDVIAGQSSVLYEKMYDEGLIDSSFNVEYVPGTFFGSTIFSGSSRDPQKVRSYILREIDRLKNGGINEDRFSIIKKKHVGRFLRGFNSLDQIVTAQIDMLAKGIDLFDLAQKFSEISIDRLEDRLHSHFRVNNHAMSVILPAS